MTAISPSWICLLASFAWPMVVLSGGIRWRAADEGISLFTRWGATPGQNTTEMAAVRRASFAQLGDLLDGRNARGHRALPPHGADGSERRGRSAVETLRRRHRARSAISEGRGHP